MSLSSHLGVGNLRYTCSPISRAFITTANLSGFLYVWIFYVWISGRRGIPEAAREATWEHSHSKQAILLIQWFLNLSSIRITHRAGLKHQLLGPTPRVDSIGWDGAWELTFLTRSQMMLLLLAQWSYFRIAVLNNKSKWSYQYEREFDKWFFCFQKLLTNIFIHTIQWVCVCFEISLQDRSQSKAVSILEMVFKFILRIADQ